MNCFRTEYLASREAPAGVAAEGAARATTCGVLWSLPKRLRKDGRTEGRKGGGMKEGRTDEGRKGRRTEERKKRRTD